MAPPIMRWVPDESSRLKMKDSSVQGGGLPGVVAPDPARAEEAGARFRRGVELYAEGDLSEGRGRGSWPKMRARRSQRWTVPRASCATISAKVWG
jgi:hypothetical protein